MCNKFKYSYINFQLFIKGSKYYKPMLEILVRFIFSDVISSGIILST